MNSSIWKRLYTTLIIFLAVILVACGLAWWGVHTSNHTRQVSEQLASETVRLRYFATVISDSLRTMLLSPREVRVQQQEKKRVRDALADMKSSIKELNEDFSQEPRIVEPLKQLQNFIDLTLDLHVASTIEKIESDPIGVRDSFLNTHAAVAEQRDRLVSNVIRAFDEIRREGEIRSLNWGIIVVVGLLIAGVIGIFVIRYVSSTVSIPLKQLVDVMERMRNGDFTQRVVLNRKDEFGVLGDGLNRLADDLSVLVGQVQRSGVQVNITATQISATSREQQSTTTEIAATTAEIGATSKQISATSRELDKTMNEVVEVAHETADLAGSGQTGITRMESTMRQIMDASGSISGKLAVLNEKTSNINTVVTTITKVADQTNLLSLNAAIEAEKAGEYGLGFAVVAMEIRRLADQTAVATYDIEKMVKEMQSAVAAGVMGMDKFSEEVRRGVDEIRQVSTQLAQIIHQVQTLTPRFATVSEGMHAQATGAQQISETLTQLSEAAHQTADSLRQSNLAIEQLNEAARGLQTSVARFKLEVK
ncbi:MAG: methyl-accepting chemotaxis protein [Verrucomicrobiota bacterium]